jgi:hypothetical protein
MVLLLVFLVIKRDDKPEDEDKDQDQDYDTAPSANIG